MRNVVVVFGLLAGCSFAPGAFVTTAPEDAPTDPSDADGGDASPDAPVARVCDPDETSLLLCLSFDAPTFGATMDNEGTAEVTAELTAVTRSVRGAGGAVEVTPASKIYIPGDSMLGGARTLEMWTRIDIAPATDGARVGLIDADSTPSAMSFFYYRQNATTYQVRFEITAQRFINHTVPLGTWVHLAEVCDSGTLTSYVDGDVVDSVNVGCNPGTAEDFGLIIGANNLQNGNKNDELTGAIDAIRIWTTARTPTQICEAAGKPTCP